MVRLQGGGFGNQGSPIQLSTPPTETEKATFTRTLQVIVAALVMGASFFGGILFFTSVDGAELEHDPTDLMFLVVVGFTLMVLSARSLVGRVMIKATMSRIQGLPRDEQESQLWASYQPYTIIRGACLEGPAFFALVMFQVTGNPLNLYIAVALIFFLILSIPTRFRIENWVEDRLTQLELSGNRF